MQLTTANPLAVFLDKATHNWKLEFECIFTVCVHVPCVFVEVKGQFCSLLSLLALCGFQGCDSGHQACAASLWAISEAGKFGVFNRSIYKVDWKYTTLKENLSRVKAYTLKTVEHA